MILIDLIYNLTLLIAMSVVSGFVDARWPRETRRGAILQGVLFGASAIIGMLRPVAVGPGLIFDGRSVMLSLGALFFGPWAAGVACLMAILLRLGLGGVGVSMGVLVILSSALIGVVYHLRQSRQSGEMSPASLLGFGLVVHLAMLAMVVVLPAELRWPVLGSIVWPVLLAYPLATVLIGKILSDQASRWQFVAALAASEAKFRAVVETSPLAIHLSAGIDQQCEYVNPMFVHCFGYRLEEIPTAAEWWPLAYPDAGYRSQITADWKTRIQHAIASQTPIEPMETLVTCRDGSQKNILWGFVSTGDKQYSWGLDLTKRKLAEQANQTLLSVVQAEKNRLTALIGSITDEVWFAEQHGRFTLVNPSGRREFRLADDAIEVAALARSLEVFRPDGSPRPVEESPPLLALAGQVVSNQEEIVRTPADGKMHYRQVSASPVRDAAGGIIGSVCVVRDITEHKRVELLLKQSLAEKETLLKETHHRVKNNLQIISSLLRLQAGRSDHPGTKAAMLDMQHRIHSMALSHETLYRSENLAAVSLDDYLARLCQQLFAALGSTSGKQRLALDLAPSHLGIDQAIPCGLIVNELVSNAFKHAFPGGRGGEVRVVLHARPEGAGWHLRVADDGVGLPPGLDLQNLTSLGLKLASDLARQLGGRLEIGAGPGAVFEIEFKASKS